MTSKIKDFNTIIYHSPCSDGTTSLWICNFYKSIQNINKYKCEAGKDPPIDDIINQNILFIDICPSINLLLKICEPSKLNKVVILDHHISNQELYSNNSDLLTLIKYNLYYEFDMTKSACQMTWDYFFDNTLRPFFIDYVADKDLQLWKLPMSKEINSALWSLNYINDTNFNMMNELFNNPQQKSYLESCGKIIEACNQREIEVCMSNAVKAKFNFFDKTYNIWLVAGNINPVLKCDLGNKLCHKPFANETMPDFVAICFYYPNENKWKISLRCIQTENKLINVALIAKSFGGGGHKNSAAFCITYDSLLDIFTY